MREQPITANRYYIRDEWGEILLEVDDYEVALRWFVRLGLEGKRVRLIDRKESDETYHH